MYTPYELDREYLAARQAERERDYAFEEAREAAAQADNDLCDRVFASLKAGESEEEFEIKEAALQAEQYRLTERLNADVLGLFAKCAPAWRHDETLSESVARRAA